jgi:TonB family protein
MRGLSWGRGQSTTVRCMRGLFIASTTFCVFAAQSRVMQAAAMRAAGTAYLQESGAGVPLGKLIVAPGVMEGHCITKVSPAYPQADVTSRTKATVVVRVVIWKSGSVSPVRVVSGDSSLEVQATNAVRLWRYKPFLRDGEAMDVTTDISVDFDPQTQGGMISHPKHNQ